MWWWGISSWFSQNAGSYLQQLKMLKCWFSILSVWADGGGGGYLCVSTEEPLITYHFPLHLQKCLIKCYMYNYWQQTHPTWVWANQGLLISLWWICIHIMLSNIKKKNSFATHKIHFNKQPNITALNEEIVKNNSYVSFTLHGIGSKRYRPSVSTSSMLSAKYFSQIRKWNTGSNYTKEQAFNAFVHTSSKRLSIPMCTQFCEKFMFLFGQTCTSPLFFVGSSQNVNMTLKFIWYFFTVRLKSLLPVILEKCSKGYKYIP